MVKLSWLKVVTLYETSLKENHMDTLSYFAAELKQHKDALQAIYFLLVGVFGVVGIYFLRQRTIALQQSSNASTIQAELAKTSQINDQYIKSIDQLGNDNSVIRLGGIYGLEQVAHSSEIFFRQVIEVLTAYIREHATEPDDSEIHEPRNDVQAILNVLGRTNNNDCIRFDLSQAYLSGYNLKGDFSSAYFREANLSRAYGQLSNFTASDFIRTDLTKCAFIECDFSKADFTDANLNDARCSESNFTGAFFGDATLKDADFRDTNLTHLSCWTPNFSEADCSGAIGLEENDWTRGVIKKGKS